MAETINDLFLPNKPSIPAVSGARATPTSKLNSSKILTRKLSTLKRRKRLFHPKNVIKKRGKRNGAKNKGKRTKDKTKDKTKSKNPKRKTPK
jgi:hypothetical protein